MRWLKLFLAVVAGTLTTSVLRADPLKVDTLEQGTINLKEPTSWVSPSNAQIQGPVSIITHGNDFTWRISGDLIIQRALDISSFTDEELSENRNKIPSPPIPSPRGASFNPGPESEGCGVSCEGASGGAGKPGVAGSPGAPGKSAGRIIILISGAASGQVTILNRGMDGGPGGRGGDGGPGGDGQQGGRAVSGDVLGLALGCKSGPGIGGNGGNGGPGGPGGSGGNAGSGGDIVFSVAGKTANFHLTYSTAPGVPGLGGEPGSGGPGGRFGFGGRGAAGCIGRESDRRGTDGALGPRGAAGVSGTPGAKGNVTVNPDTLATSPL
jgi:hypothetical protein